MTNISEFQPLLLQEDIQLNEHTAVEDKAARAKQLLREAQAHALVVVFGGGFAPVEAGAELGGIPDTAEDVVTDGRVVQQREPQPQTERPLQRVVIPAVTVQRVNKLQMLKTREAINLHRCE